MGPRRIEVVQRAGDQQVGVGVEVLAELVALVAQVALDLELDVLGAEVQLGVAQLAAELGLHRIVRQVGDVADHAGHAQAALGHHAMGVEVAAVEVRVGHDGRRATSLKAMFCADRLGAVATATQWRRRSG
jgi:hypothetical protein